MKSNKFYEHIGKRFNFLDDVTTNTDIHKIG